MSNSTKDSKEYGNFVAPYREHAPQTIEIEVTRDLPQAPNTVLLPHAGYEDRARGFSIAIAPLSAVVGIVAALIGISAFGVPVLSVAALLLALAGFAIVWLIAFVAHMIISPDGAVFLHTVFMWNHIKREQRERFRRYGMKGRNDER